MTGTGGTSAEIVLAEALKKGGLTTKDVEIIQIPYPDLNTALKTGALDAPVHFEPLFTVGINQGFSVSWKRADEIYSKHQPDQRGYGQTERPADVRQCTQLHLVGDVVGVGGGSHSNGRH